VSLVAILAAAGIAAAVDLRTGRIPNVITATVALAGLAAAAVGVSEQSTAGALTGAALGLLLMLPGHLFGGTGAGDVKLLAALGTWLGPAGTVVAFICSAIAGGVLAIGHAIHRGRFAETLKRTARLLGADGVAKREIDRSAAASRFAYGPAIAVGAVVAALLR